MDRKKLFKHLSYLVFFIFVLNFIANKFYWYYSIWWSDMLMHFLGGFWLGLVCIWLLSFVKIPVEIDYYLIFKVFLWVLIVGVLWEVFEFYFINYIAQNQFNILDTISDIFFDLSGGMLAIFYFIKRIMYSDLSTV